MYNYAYNLCIIRTYSALIPPRPWTADADARERDGAG